MIQAFLTTCDTAGFDGLAEWKRTTLFDDATGEFYVPYFLFSESEEEALLCVAFDGVGYVLESGHVYVPADWVRRERPETEPAIARLKAHLLGVMAAECPPVAGP